MFESHYSSFEFVEHISAVTLEDVQVLARDLFEDNHYTLSTIGPLEKPLDLQSFLP